MWRRDDLNHVPVVKLGAQWRELLIDSRRRAMMSDIGVDVVGEVDHRRATRQGHDLAPGRKHVDLIGKEVDLDVFEELCGIPALHLEQRLQPSVRLDLQVGAAFLDILVQPVRSHAFLGDMVHFLRADLYLDRRTVRADQRRVQRLVTIGLGNGNVCLLYTSPSPRD